MSNIEKGKELQVASHRLRLEDCQIKSLNYDRAKQVAQATDRENQNILKSIQTVKTGIPGLESLRNDWQKNQTYRSNLQQKRYT